MNCEENDISCDLNVCGAVFQCEVRESFQIICIVLSLLVISILFVLKFLESKKTSQYTNHAKTTPDYTLVMILIKKTFTQLHMM